VLEIRLLADGAQHVDHRRRVVFEWARELSPAGVDAATPPVDALRAAQEGLKSEDSKEEGTS